MTLLQLKYVVIIAECGSLSKASEKAFVSQPSLSATLKDLENEIGIKIFYRNNRGLVVTSKGNEFLSYARQVLLQYSLIEDKYLNQKMMKKKFSISTQHYSFAIKAFINVINSINSDEYDFAIRETKTHEVIDDVRYHRSEIGILYNNAFNKKILEKIFLENDLEFELIFECNIFVYLWKENPLATKSILDFNDLEQYPCLSFEQDNAFYFSEEVFSTHDYKKVIKANDRATMLNLMKGVNGYTFCSGFISEDLNGTDYVAIPLKTEEQMAVGYIKKKTIPLSELGEKYLSEIKKLIIGKTYS